ncbi:DUF6046 domain-containing protein [Brumimicrobium mesophilum]|uniref:DUF6046 domain-containing protein n=1 Tax=Brumimicrobium mesophilum TaxID=392717 RepID=UPI000D140C90|nr:DUF6046 domain-containing protein [Brumimicrobium mesophilum]
MKFNSNEILLASLVGSKVAKQIPRFQVIQNELSKRVLPPIPFLPLKNESGVEEGSNYDLRVNANTPLPKEKQFFPLSIKRRGTNDPFYTLPYEPIININGANIITKRQVSKAPKLIGTIKEHWSQDDYQINIVGTLIGAQETGSPQETFPRDDFEALRDYCTHPAGLEVQCEPLQLLGINNIVVESFDFPFSKGENVQAYTISALSDFSVDFLLEIED